MYVSEVHIVPIIALNYHVILDAMTIITRNIKRQCILEYHFNIARFSQSTLDFPYCTGLLK